MQIQVGLIKKKKNLVSRLTIRSIFVSGRVSVIALGSMTNVATAIALNDNFIKNVKRIYISGSSAHGYGNFAPNVEFNFAMDPHSNAIVLNSKAKIPFVVVPLETTQKTNIDMVSRFAL